MPDVVVLIARVVSTCVQFFAVLYVAFIAWLVSAWMADDSWAAVANDADWWLEAGRRWAVGLGAAVVIGGLLLVLNYALVRWNLAAPRARPMRSAIIGASIVAAASAAGAIQFAIERPWF
jgi:hypothetical protein